MMLKCIVMRVENITPNVERLVARQRVHTVHHFREMRRPTSIDVASRSIPAPTTCRSMRRICATTATSYEEFIRRLAEASGVETPTRADVARFDRSRKDKKTSNADWQSPQDPDAKIAKMKDGRTHLAHKAEHGVDMDTGAIVSVIPLRTSMTDRTLFVTTALSATALVIGVVLAEVQHLSRKYDRQYAEMIRVFEEAADDRERRSQAAAQDREQRSQTGAENLERQSQNAAQHRARIEERLLRIENILLGQTPDANVDLKD